VEAAPRRGGPASRNRLAFTAVTLEGWRFDFARRNARRRLVVYLVDVTAPKAARCTAVAQRLHKERHPYNLEVIGVVVPPGYRPLSARRVPFKRPSAAGLAKVARDHLAKVGATFPCVVDPDGVIIERYVKAWGLDRLDEIPAFYPFAVRAKGIVGRPIFARYAAKSAEPGEYLRRRLLKQFGIEATADVDPLAGHHPRAPEVALTDTDGKTHRLRDYRGQALILVFIAKHCPRCKDELKYLGEMYGAYGPSARKESARLELLTVCSDLKGEALKKLATDRGYKFPVAADPDWKVRSAFRYRGATPDTFVIAPDGRIRFRHRGYTADLKPVLHMEIRTLLGLTSRPLLKHGVFSGDRACRICHMRQYTDWSLTRHACAWETLVRLGKENDPKCVRCHVVGKGQPGGFISAKKSRHLADVQCESCHGQNGCRAFHRNKGNVPMKPDVCLPCHDRVHSPRFDFAAYRPRVLHKRFARLATLPRAEREARLRRLCSGARDQLFDPDTPYVGSVACAKCHPTEHKALKDGRHARALVSLAKPARNHWSIPRHKRGVVGLRRAECVRCHVTGYGRPGGFPSPPPARPLGRALGGVGCEACHGPGKAHADDPKKPRAIVKLGGACPECNVLPICRQCHDDANSPDFDYRTALLKAKHPVGKAVTP